MKKFIKGIAIVSALLMAMTAFTACGNNSSSSKSEESSASVSSETKEESKKEESSKDESKGEESKEDQTSRTDTGSATKLIDNNGLEIADDPAINVNDSTAEAIITKAIEEKGLSSMTSTIVKNAGGRVSDASIFAKGNTFVFEMVLSDTISESDKNQIKPGLESTNFSSQLKFDELKDKTGLSLAFVLAVIDSDGSLYISKVYS